MNLTPIERFQIIFRKLMEHGPRTQNELASVLEVGSQTVGRDLDFMRDRLGIELESSYDGWRIAGKQGGCLFCSGHLNSQRHSAAKETISAGFHTR